MKPFKFTLQAVRAVREREEHGALREYVAALRQLEDTKRTIDAIDRQLVAGWDELRRAMGQSAQMRDVTRLQDYCDMVLERKREMESVLQTMRQKANRAFARYLAAHQACAVVERCYENQKGRYHHQRVKHEQKSLDDIAQRSMSLATLINRSRGTIWN